MLTCSGGINEPNEDKKENKQCWLGKFRVIDIPIKVRVEESFLNKLFK